MRAAAPSAAKPVIRRDVLEWAMELLTLDAMVKAVAPAVAPSPAGR
jgi:hypothetical protein